MLRWHAMIVLACAMGHGGHAYGYSPRRDVDLRLRFNGLDNLPDFDFYLKYRVAGSLHLAPVRGQAVELKAPSEGSLSEVFLVAVAHGQHIAVPNPINNEWLGKAPPGGLQSAPLQAKKNGPLLPGWPSVLVEITYHVSIDGPTLEARCVRRSDEFPWDSLAELFAVVGAGVSLFVLVVAYWRFRNRRRATSIG